MVNTITLTNASLSTSTAVKLYNGDFRYSWKNLTKVDPGSGFFGDVEAQTNGWENPLISLKFFIPIDNIGSGYMTWALWNEFARYQYDGTNQTLLSVSVGSSDTSFTSYSLQSSGVSSIPVIIKSYDLIFSPSDSRDAGFWTISAQLQTTK